jgi:hypothetical protein
MGGRVFENKTVAGFFGIRGAVGLVDGYAFIEY